MNDLIFLLEKSSTPLQVIYATIQCLYTWTILQEQALPGFDRSGTSNDWRFE
jgi:hypothetical protein